MNMKTIAVLCLMFLFVIGLVVASPRPCGCRPTFEFCANDYTTYHSICEYKCLNPTIQYQDWFILYRGPCYYEPTTTTRTTTTRTTTTKTPEIGPCGCKSDYVFCYNDFRTYHSICEYKCKNPSTPFNKGYVRYNGPCGSKVETTTENVDSQTNANNVNG